MFIQKFLQHNCSDEKLNEILSSAKKNKLAYNGNCLTIQVLPYEIAKTLPYALAAEYEFKQLSYNDDERNALLVPILEAEIAKRGVVEYPVPYKA